MLTQPNVKTSLTLLKHLISVSIEAKQKWKGESESSALFFELSEKYSCSGLLI